VPSVAALLEALDRRAPFAKAARWDRVGLQLGDPEARVERIGVCHEVTEAVVEALAERPVELLISYHPLLFEPVERLVAGPGPAGRALALARRGIALAVCHTNFDVAPEGAADALADALELQGVRPFAPLESEPSYKVATFLPAQSADALLEGVARAGAARIGNYTHCSFRAPGEGSFFAGAGTAPAVGVRHALNREPEVRIEFPVPAGRLDAVLAALVGAHPYEEPAYDVYARPSEAGFAGRCGVLAEEVDLAGLAQRVERALGRAPRLAGAPERRIGAVAVVPGAGASALAEAAARGADVLVTGDVSHHRARAALDLGLALLDPGHAATERPGLARLLAFAATLGPQATSFLDLDADPWASP
jgi:dinuclear metal center YbgI/SA1388 family protein